MLRDKLRLRAVLSVLLFFGIAAIAVTLDLLSGPGEPSGATDRVITPPHIPNCTWSKQDYTGYTSTFDTKFSPRSLEVGTPEAKARAYWIACFRTAAKLAELLAREHNIAMTVRNSNLLVAYRQDPSVDAFSNIDLDVHIIGPGGRDLLGFINRFAERHRAELKASVVFTANLFAQSFMYGDMGSMWVGCVCDHVDFAGYGESCSSGDCWGIDVNALSPELVFDDSNFQTQVAVVTGIDVKAFFSPENLCFAQYLGVPLLAVERQVEAFLLELYGPRFRQRYDAQAATEEYYFNFMYPRRVFRTELGKAAFCWIGNTVSKLFGDGNTVDGITWFASWRDTHQYRDRKTHLFRKGVQIGCPCIKHCVPKRTS